MRNRFFITALTTSLAAAGFFSDFNAISNSMKGFHIQIPPPFQLAPMTSAFEKPLLIAGYPQHDDDDQPDSLEIRFYQVGFIHYGYKIVTAVVVASDAQFAEMKAYQVKQQFDEFSANQHPNSTGWKMYLNSEPLSNASVVDLSVSAEILITVC